MDQENDVATDRIRPEAEVASDFQEVNMGQEFPA